VLLYRFGTIRKLRNGVCRLIHQNHVFILILNEFPGQGDLCSLLSMNRRQAGNPQQIA
jgi:hypothetical protein